MLENLVDNEDLPGLAIYSDSESMIVVYPLNLAFQLLDHERNAFEADSDISLLLGANSGFIVSWSRNES